MTRRRVPDPPEPPRPGSSSPARDTPGAVPGPAPDRPITSSHLRTHDAPAPAPAGSDAGVVDDPSPALPQAEPWPEGPLAGERLVRTDAVVTAVFVLVGVVAAIWPRPVTAYPAAALAGVVAVAGCVAFGWGYLLAIGRSRHETIDLPGLFWLKGTAPPAARRTLIGLLWVQVGAALAVAAARPYTVLAFGVLAPLWGLGVITLWAGKHGRFPRKA